MPQFPHRLAVQYEQAFAARFRITLITTAVPLVSIAPPEVAIAPIRRRGGPRCKQHAGSGARAATRSGATRTAPPVQCSVNRRLTQIADADCAPLEDVQVSLQLGKGVRAGSRRLNDMPIDSSSITLSATTMPVIGTTL